MRWASDRSQGGSKPRSWEASSVRRVPPEHPILKGLPQTQGELTAPAATRPLQVVEFDGHRLDVRLKVVVRDPLGFEHEFELERVWLLVIIDVRTRVVLAYHLVLAREYSRYDVIKTIEKALEPHKLCTFSIPGLGYGSHAGFASQRLPELAYAMWEWMRLDNAKANLAQETLKALCEFVGCFADAGAPHHPDERPYIERFFGTIARTMSSRLPGYTGSHPKDLRRALTDPKGNLRLFVSLDELEELVEFSIATYNATPHSGLNGRTPLEALEHWVRGKHAPLNWLPQFHRRTLCLMQSARRCAVRSYLKAGARPHINLYGVRYTSPELAEHAPYRQQATGLHERRRHAHRPRILARWGRARHSDGARRMGCLDPQPEAASGCLAAAQIQTPGRINRPECH
jgi:putative transposase